MPKLLDMSKLSMGTPVDLTGITPIGKQATTPAANAVPAANTGAVPSSIWQVPGAFNPEPNTGPGLGAQFKAGVEAKTSGPNIFDRILQLIGDNTKPASPDWNQYPDQAYYADIMNTPPANALQIVARGAGELVGQTPLYASMATGVGAPAAGVLRLTAGLGEAADAGVIGSEQAARALDLANLIRGSLEGGAGFTAAGVLQRAAQPDSTVKSVAQGIPADFTSGAILDPAFKAAGSALGGLWSWYKAMGAPEVQSQAEIPLIAPAGQEGASAAKEAEGGEAGQQPRSVGAAGAGFAQAKPMVDTSPINLNVLDTDKTTARDWRQELSGKQNAQIVRGNQVANAVQRMLKDSPGSEEAVTIERELHGDKGTIQAILDMQDPHVQELLDQKMEDSTLTYRQALEKALNLSDQEVQAEWLANQLYEEVGQHSVNMGTIGRKGDFQLIEDYVNHLYKPEPPQDFVKTETNKPGLSSYTSHSKQRSYASMLHAFLGLDENLQPILDEAGNRIKNRIPATMKISKLMRVLNEEMARVNTNMEFVNAAHDLGMGKWVMGDVPDGWKKIEGLQKQAAVVDKDGNPFVVRYDFAMPEGLAKGIGAAIEPNFIKRVDALRWLQKYQGVVKTVDLSYSAFHHVTMLAQLLYQTNLGLNLLVDWPRVSKALKSGGFNEMEQDFVRHTGMTTQVEYNQDVLRKLTEGDDTLAKLSNWPPFKLFLQGAEKSTEFLFDGIQRHLKVVDYWNKVEAAVRKNPEMTDAELTATKRGIAREVNNAYGGLNWKALGVSKSMQSVLRLLMLAPDWTMSNVFLAQDALGAWRGAENKAAGRASRASLGVALVGGLILTEGLNYLFTGHFTDKNPKGEELSVEVQPGVYVTLFRGGPGDVVKMASDVIRYGPQGVAMFLQGKLSPWVRTLVGLMANTDYLGRKIADPTKSWSERAVSVANYILHQGGPIPFGTSAMSQYLFGTKGLVEGAKEFLATGKLPNKQATLAGAALVGTTLGNYNAARAQSGSVFDAPAKANAGNWLAPLTASPGQRQEQDIMGQIKAAHSLDTQATKNLEEELGRAIDQGNSNLGPIFDKYKVPWNERRAIQNTVENKLKARNIMPLVSEYLSLPKRDRESFAKTLPTQDIQMIIQALRQANTSAANRAAQQLQNY